MSHPYKNLPGYQFWENSVSSVEKFELNPFVDPKFRIRVSDRIVTVGSCFAQHLSRELERNGFTYLVTESGENLSEQERISRNYGVYSARYGNVYTPRQFRQLIEEAFGISKPLERVWVGPTPGVLVDPYRPAIEPYGFSDEAMLESSRQVMLDAVREMILQGDVLVYTLGLTEAWVSRVDGWVFPVAPGVSGGAFDEKKHAFANFKISEVIDDLSDVLLRIKGLNPRMKVVLTVSPVPLVATYEKRSVLSSTIYSKSVLRVAADEMARAHDWILYFPSYEIIAGSPTFGSYYASDLRQVNRAGVSHVMRMVMESLVEVESVTAAAEGSLRSSPKWNELVCDEEGLGQSK